MSTIHTTKYLHKAMWVDWEHAGPWLAQHTNTLLAQGYIPILSESPDDLCYSVRLVRLEDHTDTAGYVRDCMHTRALGLPRIGNVASDGRGDPCPECKAITGSMQCLFCSGPNGRRVSVASAGTAFEAPHCQFIWACEPCIKELHLQV